MLEFKIELIWETENREREVSSQSPFLKPPFKLVLLFVMQDFTNLFW